PIRQIHDKSDVIWKRCSTSMSDLMSMQTPINRACSHPMQSTSWAHVDDLPTNDLGFAINAIEFINKMASTLDHSLTPMPRTALPSILAHFSPSILPPVCRIPPFL